MVCDRCQLGCPADISATCHCPCHQPKPRAFHFHVQEEYAPIDGQPGCWVVDGCCPSDDIENFEKSRRAWLCTSDIWEVPVAFEDCVFQTHKDCHEGGYTCRHQRDYRPVKGSKIYSPGMPKAEYEAREHDRWLKCKVCQSKSDSMYGKYCPGH